MATTYAYGKNDVWVDTGATGPCDIQAQDGGTSLLHFGATLPATYGDGVHLHLEPNDSIYKYRGTDKVYVRSANNNMAGIKQTCKIAITTTV